MLLGKFRVHENSMLPEFPAGSLVVTENLSYLLRSPRAGEIVVVEHESLKQIKRVRHVFNESVEVAGDNQEESVLPFVVKKNQIIGRVFRSQ